MVESETIWNGLAACPVPTFPCLFWEIAEAREIRGFLELSELLGDIDFAGYAQNDASFLIDVEGFKYSLGFSKEKKLCYPSEREGPISTEEFKRHVCPVVNLIKDDKWRKQTGLPNYHYLKMKDDELIRFVGDSRDIAGIVRVLAGAFAW